MLSFHYVKLGAFLILAFLTVASSAQYAIAEVDLEKDMSLWYDMSLGRQNTGILTGQYEKFERSSVTTHAFFQKDTWSNQKLKYRGQIYDSIFIMYDVYKDLLLIRHPTEFQYFSQPVKLIQPQISWFQLRGHLFRYYNHDILNYSPGFFDELYIGEAFDLIVKRIKTMNTNGTREVVFEPEDAYIIRLKDQYSRLRRRGSLLRLFNDQKMIKKEIKQFIKSNGLIVKPANEADLIQLARFCDEILTSG